MNSTLSTASKRNDVMAGLSRTSTVSWGERRVKHRTDVNPARKWFVREPSKPRGGDFCHGLLGNNRYPPAPDVLSPHNRDNAARP